MALEAAILPPGSHFKTRGAEGGKKHAAKKHNRTNKAGGSTVSNSPGSSCHALAPAASDRANKCWTGQAQYCDVEAAEAAARKTMENLQFIQRAARSPMQENALRRAVSSMKEELEAMVHRPELPPAAQPCPCCSLNKPFLYAGLSHSRYIRGAATGAHDVTSYRL